MSLKLYLMRHAQSADKQPGQADKERELTNEGMLQSLQIGGYLQAEKFFVTTQGVVAKPPHPGLSALRPSA